MTDRFTADGWRRDAVIAVVLFMVAASIGGAYRRLFVASGIPEEFGVYREGGASLALACGHGYRNPGYFASPAVDEFLRHQRDSITCADLPSPIPKQVLTLTQGLYRYLMTAIALVWVLTGTISWSGLTPLFALEYGLTVVAAYGIFRLGIGRVMSVAATLVFLVSALHLGFVPYLRDYSKAPFVQTLILIMGRLATGPLTWKRAIGYGTAFGLVLGIGFGFRNDLMINVLPWAAVVVFLAGGSVRAYPGRKAACLAVSAALFLITARPILTAYSGGSNSGHVTLLGLMSSFNLHLGIDQSIYEWGYLYDDGYANRLINSFSYRESGHPVKYLSAAYDRAMFDYILRIIRHFPADFLARTYGAVVKVLEFPFTVGAYIFATPNGIRNPAVLAFYGWQIWFLRALNGTGLALTVLALLVISIRSVRAAAALLVFLIYFAGYPAIQFSLRHFFHLEIITWWALAFLIDRTAVPLWRRFRPARFGPPIPLDLPPVVASARRVVTFAVLAAVALASPLIILRAYQAPHVRALIERSYLAAEREPIEIVKTPVGSGRVLFDASAVWNTWDRAEEFASAYIVAEFSSACGVPGESDVVATIRYQSLPGADYSHDVTVPLVAGGEPTLIFFPVFADRTYSHFTGVELPASDAGCLVGVSQVRKDRVPDVLLGLTLTPHWRQAKLYATLVRFENPRHGEIVAAVAPVESAPVKSEPAPPAPAVVAPPVTAPVAVPVAPPPPPPVPQAPPGTNVIVNPEDLRIPTTPEPTPFVAPNAEAEYLGPLAELRPDKSLAFKGRDDVGASMMHVIRQQRLQAGAIVIARGEVRKGGVVVGLIGSDNGPWAVTVNVILPGPFVAAFPVPRDDIYTVVVADSIPNDWLYRQLPKDRPWLWSIPGLRRLTDVVVSSLGWVPPPARGGAVR